MRIIAGTYRGKKLVSAPESITRPTSDRAKEGLFNVLDSWLLKIDKRWQEIVFVDVFAGSGAIGLEALSRGAKKVVFFEADKTAQRFLKTNLQGVKGQTYLMTDALKPSYCTQPTDIIFMDPPYESGLDTAVLRILRNSVCVTEDTLIIVEASLDRDLKEFEDCGFSVSKEKKYKSNKHVFLYKEG